MLKNLKKNIKNNFIYYSIHVTNRYHSKYTKNLYDIVLYKNYFDLYSKKIYKTFCFTDLYSFIKNNNIDYNNIYLYISYFNLFEFFIDENSLIK